MVRGIGIRFFIIMLGLPFQVAVAENLVDPTKPFEAKPVVVELPVVQEIPKFIEERPLILKSIKISEDYKMAIINNKTVRPGDNIEGKKVVDIKNHKVVLEGDVGIFEVTFDVQDIKIFNGQGGVWME